MKLPDKLQTICRKCLNRETISYLFFGVITTIINYAAAMVCFYFFHIEEVTSNNIAWAVAVIFAFFVNKVFVFESKSWEAKRVIREFYTFIIARLLSLLFENVFVYIASDICHIEFAITKVVSNVFVMIMNYFASKFVSFKKTKTAGDTGVAKEVVTHE